MQTLELPINGHARFDADFAEVQRQNELPIAPPVQDPIESPDPTKPERKPLKSVAFQKLLDEIAQEDSQPRAERPAFPLHALPPALRAWVEGIAAHTQTAPEAAAMLALAASSAALAGRIRILGTNDDWHSPNLYLGVLTNSDRCDEVMSAAIEPLRELEAEELESNVMQRAKDIVFKREQQRAMRKLERQLEEGDTEGLASIDHERAELEAYEITPAPRRILDDVTARSLRFQLGQLGRIACFSPTGDIFQQIAGRSCASRQRLFETLDAGHAARRLVIDGPRGKQEAVKRPTITIASLVDRSLVSTIASQRECSARSLLSRFLFIAPESPVGSGERAKGLAPEVAATYRERIRGMANRSSAQLILSPEALGAMVRWELELESQLGPRGALAPIGDWGKKLASTTLRLAGILHVWSENPTTMIADDALAAAIEIARWLIPQAAHALEKLGAADDHCTDRERALLRYARLLADSGVHEFSPSSAWQHLRKTFLHADAMKHALAQLVRRGYLCVAREGEKFPRRFALAGLAVALVPRVWESKRDKKKKDRAAQAIVSTPVAPIVASQNESTESTQRPAAARLASRRPNRAERRRAAKRAE